MRSETENEPMRIPPHNPNLIVPTDGVGNDSWTNGDRAESARKTIEHYGQQRRMDPDERTLSIDLITDILHFLHSQKMDPNEVLEAARMHFKTEAIG